MGDGDFELYQSELSRRGLRRSRTRDSIVRMFLSSSRHWSPEELFEQSRAQKLRGGLSTVYRTLRLLLEIGLAREVDLGDGVRHYERSTNFPAHYHLICARCHSVIEFLANAVEEQVRAISASYSFAPSSHVLKVEGICARCRGEKAGRPVSAGEHELVLKRDALLAVIAVERTGLVFYKKRARGIAGKLGKLWATLMEEEAEHLAILKDEMRRFLADHPQIRQAPRILHQTLPWKSRPETPVDASEETVLSQAIGWERMTARFFRTQAENLPPCEARDIFGKFSEAEKVHLILLQAEYNRRTGRGLPYLEAQV